MKVSVVLSTLIVAGLVSAAPPGARMSTVMSILVISSANTVLKAPPTSSRLLPLPRPPLTATCRTTTSVAISPLLLRMARPLLPRTTSTSVVMALPRRTPSFLPNQRTTSTGSVATSLRLLRTRKLPSLLRMNTSAVTSLLRPRMARLLLPSRRTTITASVVMFPLLLRTPRPRSLPRMSTSVVTSPLPRRTPRLPPSLLTTKLRDSCGESAESELNRWIWAA